MALALGERAAAPVLPADLRPMLAQPASGPLSSPEYAFEVKWDGMRVLAGLDGERLSLRTRNGIEALPRFPELRALRDVVERSQAILDGEIVRMVGGRPNFWMFRCRLWSGIRTDSRAQSRRRHDSAWVQISSSDASIK